jgi:hypothetical protein
MVPSSTSTVAPSRWVPRACAFVSLYVQLSVHAGLFMLISLFANAVHQVSMNVL